MYTNSEYTGVQVARSVVTDTTVTRTLPAAQPEEVIPCTTAAGHRTPTSGATSTLASGSTKATGPENVNSTAGGCQTVFTTSPSSTAVVAVNAGADVVAVAVALAVALDVLVAVALEVEVSVAVLVPVDVPVALELDVSLDVEVPVAVAVALEVAVSLAVLVPVDVPVALELEVSLAVDVPEDVLVDVPVALELEVSLAVDVSEDVLVEVAVPLDVPVALEVLVALGVEVGDGASYDSVTELSWLGALVPRSRHAPAATIIWMRHKDKSTSMPSTPLNSNRNATMVTSTPSRANVFMENPTREISGPEMMSSSSFDVIGVTTKSSTDTVSVSKMLSAYPVTNTVLPSK
jgi:hypothetical protein